MIISDIISDKRHSVGVDEMIYLVESYVKDVKHKNITVNIYQNSMVNKRLNPLAFKIEIKKLFRAFTHALAYYKKNESIR